MQITDIHYDANYSTSGKIVDMCHVPLNGASTDDNISKWGNFDCDTSWPLVENALQFLKQQYPDPDFVLWTGLVSLSSLI